MSFQTVNPTPIAVPEPIQYSSLKDVRNQISKLLSVYVSPALLIHLISTEVAMFELAKYFNEENEAERWALAGLVHDIDWDATGKNADIHCGLQTREMLIENQIPVEIIDDAFSHYGFLIVDGQTIGFIEHGTGIEADTTLRKALFSADELTGFIYACGRVRPSKSIIDLETSSVLKKLKDKSFAAQVDRNLIRACEQTLNIPLNDFVDLVLQAMKKYREYLESIV